MEETITGRLRLSYFTVKKIVDGDDSREVKLQKICEMLKEEVSYFDWVGFYLVDKSGKNLVLGPYSGKPTEHKKIPFGKGVCGQVAQKKKTMVVQDISQETNYLSCSLDVKSEAAVPIIKDLNFVGALDVDSNEEAPFKRDDVAYLEDICHLVEKLF